MEVIKNAVEDLEFYWRRGAKQKAIVSAGVLFVFGFVINALAWLVDAL